MLAILQIKMRWTKECRTPDGARLRQTYYAPVPIEPDVNLTGDGIFVKKQNYRQETDGIFCDSDLSGQLDHALRAQSAGMPFTGTDEHAHRMAQQRNELIRRDQGAFFVPDRIDIPCVHIIEETENSYRVKWFDAGRGMPGRRGGNEDFGVRGAKLSGRPNTLNETAFVLQAGESGILKYNYRCTYYCGQWYECYYVYVVNADRLSPDIFLREYTYTYDQLADLF